MTWRRLCFGLAGAVLLAGLLLFVVPVHADDFTGPTACGSVLAPDRSQPDAGAPAGEVAIFDRLQGECSAALSSRTATAAVVAVIGLLGLVVVSVVGRRSAVVPVDEQQYRQQQDQADR